MGNMLKSPLHKRTLLTVLFHLISCGGFLAVAVPPASAQFKAWVMAKLPERPWGVAVDSKGNIYTTETYRGQRVQRFVYKGLAPVTSKDQRVLWPKY